MNNPAFDIPEREMLIIIDSNAESTCPEVNWAELHRLTLCLKMPIVKLNASLLVLR
jgi:hypothetical protein